MFNFSPQQQAWMQYAQEQAKKQGGDFGQAYRSIIQNGDMRNAFNQQYAQIEEAKKSGQAGAATTPLADLIAQMEAKRVDQMRTQGLNPDGSPIQPEFKSALDANGDLQARYRVSPWQNVTNDTSALDKFKVDAMRDAGTNSAWANSMLGKLGVQNAMAADQAAAGANQSMLSAASQLAQSGGLSGGSRERLMAKGAQAGFIGRQAVNRQGLMDRMNVLTQDEQNRVSQLKDLQGMNNQQSDLAFRNQQQATGVDQYNNRTLLGATQALNEFNQNNWNKRMEVWGANKQADAQSKASSGGGGSSFICSALRRYGHLSTKEAIKLTTFMLKSVLTRADFFAWYFTQGKAAVDKLEAQGFDFGKLRQAFATEILETLEHDLTAAQNEYIAKSGKLCTEVLGECGYKESMAQPGLMKSIVKIPKVFALPSTWKWFGTFIQGKVSRHLHIARVDAWVNKLSRKVG
jgi:hypothetical protein